MSAPEDALAGILAEHYPSPVWCACGWRAGLSLNDTRSDRNQTLAHVAQVLAEWAAGEKARAWDEGNQHHQIHSEGCWERSCARNPHRLDPREGA